MAAPIYNLTEFQFESLMRMANTENQLLSVIEPADTDEEATQTRLRKSQDEVNDLVTLGLLEDKSGAIVEKITADRLKIGRGYSVYIITEIGFDMFNGTNKRKPN